jgi:hypothetical protein
MTWPGEEQAWDFLSALDPEKVQRNANVIYDRELSSYEMVCFARKINISLLDRNISGNSDTAATLINEHGDYSRLSILKYLVNVKEVPLSGQLVRPTDLSGGDLFARGTHILPLEEIADLFNNDKDAFINKGQELGGQQLEYGDMALRLFPFPRVPIVLIVWSGDDEFPPRSSLLFDSSCTFHMPIDILWSTAMWTVQMMLYQGNQKRG